MILTSNEVKYISDDFIINSDTLLDTSVDSIDHRNFSLTIFDNKEFTTIPIIKVTVDPYSIHLDMGTLLPNKIYTLTAFSIPSNGYPTSSTESIDKQVFRFLSVEKIDRTTIANTNNVYTQLKWMDNVLSTEYLLKNRQDYTLSFHPSNYNFEAKRYEYSNDLITIENNKIILDNLIKQYFTEYKTFYDTINNRTVLSKDQEKITAYDNEYINNLHLVFMNNIAKWYSLKGNKTYIELMVSLFTKYLGYNLISIVEDPVYNCMYRISSSITEDVWNQQIKPYVHPLSWKVIYNQIDSNTTGGNFHPIDKNKLIRETWACINEDLSLLDSEISAFSRKSYQYNDISINSFNEEYTDVKLSYSNDFDYIITQLDLANEYDSSSNFSILPSPFVSNGTTYQNTNFLFMKSGLFTKYVWTLYINNVEIEQKTTSLSYVNFIIDTSVYTTATVQLTAYYKNGSYVFINRAICAQ